MPRPGVTVRPRLETLEVREVPATLRWTNALGTGAAGAYGNWQVLVGSTWTTASQPPAQGDTLRFDGGVTSASCNGVYGFHPDDTYPDYAAIELVNNYSGTVTFASETIPGGEEGGGSETNKGIAVNTFTMSSGAINQQYAATELFVLSSFTWSGGTINSGSFLSNVNVHGTGTIDPNGGTVTTGSNLNFFGTEAQPKTTTIQPGTIIFNNVAGAVAGNGAVVAINTVQANVTFNNANSATFSSTYMTVNTGGTVTVTGPGVWSGWNFQLRNNGGMIEIKGNSTVQFGYQGTAQQQARDVYLFNGTVRLHSGSTLKALTSSVNMQGGELVIVGNSPPGQTAPAKIDANFELFGGAISYTDAKWTFRVTGNVTWTGGEFKPRVDVGNDGIADIWHILGSLTVTNTNTPKIVPITENYVPAQGLPATLRRTILTAENGITGTPTLQSQNPTYQLYLVEGPGNQRTWKLGPPN